MSLKKMLLSLAVGVVVVAGLAIYVFVIEPTVSTTEEAAQQSGVVFPYKSGMAKLTIRDVATKLAIHRGKDEIVLEKAGPQSWRLTEPVKARADRSAVLSILDHIKDLRLESVAATTDDPAELAKFGLKDPRLTGTLWLGGESRQFSVGSQVKGETASANKSYFRVAGDPRILVVDEALIERLNKPPADFRDKHVFDQDPEKSPGLIITVAGKPVDIEKSGKAWSLKTPVADQADASKIRGLLSKARSLEADKFVSEDPSKLAQYGLDKPQLTCEIKAEDGTPMTLLIGSRPKDDDKALYAKRAEEPTIFTVKAETLNDLELKPDDVRQRQVAEFESDDVTTLDAARGKAPCVISRKAKEDTWQMAKPKEAKADSSAVGDFLSDLGKLRADHWVDDQAKADALLKAPETTITLLREPAGGKTGVKKEPVKLAISAPVKTDKEEGFYVRRGDQKFILFVSTKKPAESVSTEEKDSAKSAENVARSLSVGYLAFYDRSVFSFKEKDVAKIAIDRDGLKLACERVGENWKLTSPLVMDADRSNVTMILDAMSGLRAAEYVADSPKDLKAYGLDAPSLRITATIETKDETPKDEKKDDKAAKEKAKEKAKQVETKTLLVSRKIDGKIYGMADGSTLVFTLKDWEVGDLRTDPISTAIGDFESEAATSLTVAPNGKPEIVIQKEKDTWEITKPRRAAADQETVRKIIDSLHDLRAKRYLDYEGKDLKADGLDPAEVTVTVRLKGEDREKAKEPAKGKGPEKGKEPEKEKTFVLKIGKPVPGEKDDPGSYAQRGDARQVFLMSRGKVGEIPQSIEAIEKKPEPKAEPKVQIKAEPKPELKAEPKAVPKVEPKIVPKAEPKAEPNAQPKAPPPKAPEPKKAETPAGAGK